MLRAHVAAALNAAGTKTAEHLTQDARRQALDAGWPTEAASHVSVHHTGGAFTVHFAGAEDWEYGTETRPPSPVARGIAMHAHEGEAEEVFYRHLQAHLGHLL